MLSIIAKSWLIGIIVAAPIGPIGLLCIRKTLEMGLKGAMVVGLGAAFADALFGGFAALGLVAISDFLLAHSFYLKIGGGAILILLGAKEFFYAQPLSNNNESVTINKKAIIPIILTTFLLTLTNPLTILSFIALFTVIGEVGNFTMHEVMLIIIGIFLGSMTWWLGLGAMIHKTRSFVPPKIILGIRKGTALLLILFGIYSIMTEI